MEFRETRANKMAKYFGLLEVRSVEAGPFKLCRRQKVLATVTM